MTRPFEGALRDELIRAARHPQRRARRAGLTTIAVALAGAIGLLTVLSSGPASADVKISRDGGRIEVLLTDLHNSPESVERAMRAEGLEVHVEAAPAGPSNVGRFVRELTTTDGLEDIQRVGEKGGAFMGFSIPEDWDGALTMLLGRPARAGEPYTAVSDAFAAGEPLACAAGPGRSLEELAEDLSTYDVSVQAAGSSVPLALELTGALRDGHGTWAVTAALATSDHELIVQIADASPPPVQRRRC